MAGRLVRGVRPHRSRRCGASKRFWGEDETSTKRWLMARSWCWRSSPALAYANFAYRKQTGKAGDGRSRPGPRPRRRSCRPRARSRPSAPSTSAPTTWDASRSWRSRKAIASSAASSCCRSTRATCAQRCSGRGRPAGGAVAARAAAPGDRRRRARTCRSRATNLQAPAGAVGAAADDHAGARPGARTPSRSARPNCAQREQDVKTQDQRIRQEQAHARTRPSTT